VPRPKPAPIAEHELNAAISELIDFYRTQDSAIEDVREVVEGRNAVPVDDAYKTTGFVVRDPSVTDHVLTKSAELTVNRPKLQLTYGEGKGDETQAHQKLIAKLEPAFESLILDDAGKQGETYARVGGSLCQDGGAWSSLIVDLDAWKGPGNRYSIKLKKFSDDDGYPVTAGAKSAESKYIEKTDEAKRRARSVLKWQYHDPKTVYPVWLGDDELGAMFVVTERPKWTTLSEYGLTLDAAGNIVDVAVGQATQQNAPHPVGEKIRCVAHWTAKSVTYFVSSGKAVRKVDGWDHNYGFVPFAWSFGWRLPHWSNIKTGWGSASVLLQTVKYVSYLKTLHANLAAASVAPPYKRTVPEGGDVVRDKAGKPVEVTLLPVNGVLNLQPGEDIAPIAQADPNPHIREQIAMEMQRLQELRGPVASGNLNDAQNGFAIESVKSDRTVKSSPFTSGLQGHLEQVTRMAFRLIREKIKETVWVKPRMDKPTGHMAISPDDLTDEPLIHWDISPEQPAGAIVEGRYWHERLQAGTAGPDQAITAMGDNPADVYEDQLRAEVRKDPVIHQLALAETFAEYARGDLLARFGQLQQMVASGQVPPGGGGAMGLGQGGMVGDAGAQAMSPNGQGATPQTAQAAGIGPPVAGMPSRFGVPGQAARAMVQDLGA